MSRTDPSSSIIARSAEPSASQKAPTPPEPPPAAKALLPPQTRPEDVLGLLRDLIRKDQISQARRLTREAARRFPGDSNVRLAKHILTEGKATSNPYVQQTATAEIEWLENPPEAARGKWVALIGREIVGMADSVEELKQALEAKKFDQYPVVQYLEP